MWALDFQFDTTTDGRILKLRHVVDEHTREALAVQVERRIDADHTVSVLDRIAAARGRSPELVRMDNGPELTANALRDWCRLGGSGACYIEPGFPWENPFVESFGGKVRDKVLAVDAFDSLLEAKGPRLGPAPSYLVQIDTPEVYFGTECYGKQASATTKRLLPSGTRVRLMYELATDRVDDFGRLLRYVIRVEDGVVNLGLVAVGAAAPYFYEGRRGKYASRLELLPKTAKAEPRGLWAACPHTRYDPYAGIETRR